MKFPPYIAPRDLAGSYSMRAVGNDLARGIRGPRDDRAAGGGPFIASYAATNMNAAIGTIATDLDTSVRVCRRP